MTEARTEAATMRLVDPVTGDVMVIPEAEAGRLRKIGWREPTEAETAKSIREEASKGAAQTVGAFALGTGKYIPGATAGLKAVAGATGVQGEQFSEAAKALAEAHPIATEVGGIAGAIATGELLGTAGLGTRAMGALGAGEGAAARIGAATITGAVEGGIQGLGETSTAMALGDEEVSAAALLEGGLYGAVLGGGIGGGLTAGAAGMRYGAGKLKALGSKLVGVGSEGAVGKLAKLSEIAGVEGAEALPEFNALTEAGRANIRTAQTANDLMTEQANKLVDALDNNVRMMVEERAGFSGARKLEQMIERIPAETRAEALDASRAAISRARAKIDAMAGRDIPKPKPPGMHAAAEVRDAYAIEKKAYDEAMLARKGEYGKRAEINKALAAAAAAEQKIARATDHAEAFRALDDFKRTIGPFGEEGKNVAAMGAKERATRNQFTRMYEDLRGTLERKSLWGDAAKLQAKRNAPWARLLETQRVKGFGRYLKRTKQRGPWANSVDSLNVDNALRDLLPPKMSGDAREVIASQKAHAEAREAFKEWLDDAEKFLATTEGTNGKTAAELLPEWRRSVTEAREAMKEMDRVADISAKWKTLKGQQGGGITGAAMGYGLGALGPAGVPLAAVAGIVTNPARAMETVAAISRMIEHSTGGLGRIGGKLGKLGRQVPRVLTTSSLSDRHKNRVHRAIESVRQAADAPQQTEAQIRQRLAAITPGSPETTEAVVKVAMRGANYLAQHAPTTAPPLALGSGPVEPSDGELEEFERRRDVVLSPIKTIIGAIEDESITPEQLDALDAVHPVLAERMREQYRNAVIDVVDRGGEIPYQRGLAIGALLGEPVHALERPDVAQELQALATEEPKPPPKRVLPKKATATADIYKRDNAGLMRALEG